MSGLTADGGFGATVITRSETAARPAGLNPAAEWVLAEIERWCPPFARGELRPEGGDPPAPAGGERFAGRRPGVRAAGFGHPAALGTLHATDQRALVLGDRSTPVREWRFCELAEVNALGNWGGVALVRPGGDTELVVAAGPQPPTWQDASAWLKVEAAFAAGAGRLDRWLDGLPARLAVLGARCATLSP